MVPWKSFTFVISGIQCKKKKRFDLEVQGQDQFCGRFLWEFSFISNRCRMWNLSLIATDKFFSPLCTYILPNLTLRGIKGKRFVWLKNTRAIVDSDQLGPNKQRANNEHQYHASTRTTHSMYKHTCIYCWELDSNQLLCNRNH